MQNRIAEVKSKGNFEQSQLKQIIYEFNNTKVDYPSEKTIKMLFEEQVKKSENKTALMFLNESIKYGCLNKKSNQLARKLRSCGVKPNTIVGLVVSRSIDMIVGILGILKAGGCYLPIDPTYPEKRINYMLEDSDTKILLTQKCLNLNIGFCGDIVFLDDNGVFDGDSTNLDNINSSHDLAYVIYTSGSTGTPKGVMLENKSVHNFINGVTGMIKFSSDATIVCLTTISFDIFLLESLLPLTIGMKIIIADPMQLSKYLGNNSINMIQTTPSTMNLILKDKANLKYIKELTDIMLGGEIFPKRLFNELKKITKARIYNMYGPTETTVWSTIKNLTDSKEITLGRPIANTQIYIVDDDNNLLTIGEVGELCISGDGVSRGYLNKPKLTSERFVEDPVTFGQNMYKTGDLARWLPNGEIDFLGRKDFQVKIRGFRIELGEIEECFNKYEKVKECIVIAKNDMLDEKYLVAYYISDEDLLVSDVISFLKDSLPEYMIPGFYIRIDRIPLTPNGKIDTLSLPVPDNKRPRLYSKYVKPKTDLENKITKIWERILGLNKVGTNDNFFELGGNSVLLARMYVEIENICKGKIDIVDLFSYPTISKIIEKLIKEKNGSSLTNEILKMTFPKEFYNYENSISDEIVFKSCIEGNVLNKLKTFAQVHNISMISVILSLYMYLLYQASNVNKIEIIFADGGSRLFKAIMIDFKTVNTLEDVCIKVENILSWYPANKLYREEDIKSLLVENEKQVIPAFFFNVDKVDIKTNLLEFILYANQSDSKLEFRLAFNVNKLKTEKIEEYFKTYINLVNSVMGSNNGDQLGIVDQA